MKNKLLIASIFITQSGDIYLEGICINDDGIRHFEDVAECQFLQRHSTRHTKQTEQI